MLEDDWKVTRAREQGLTAGGPRRLKTVVSTVKNLLAVSRDAKSWQDQIKQMQTKVNLESFNVEPSLLSHEIFFDIFP